MKRLALLAAACCALVAATALAALRAELMFPDVSSVKIDDAFWSPRYALWRGTTIPDVLEKLETRSHVAANLELAATGAKGGHRGAYFFDGLLCESLRGASDYLAAKPDVALEAKIDRFVDLIAAAQRPDGYLNTRCQVGDGDKRRWGDNGGFGLDQHEIYDAGCLIEAGVHYYRATGKAKLLGCETPEEVLALAQEEGYELTDEQLEGVSGGWGGKCENQNYCFDDGRNIGE